MATEELTLPIFKYNNADHTTSNGRILKLESTRSIGLKPNYHALIGSKIFAIKHGDPVKPRDMTSWSEITSFRIGTIAVAISSIIKDVECGKQATDITKSLRDLSDMVLLSLAEGCSLVSNSEDLVRLSELQNYENKKSLERLQYEKNAAMSELQALKSQPADSTASFSSAHVTMPPQAPTTIGASQSGAFFLHRLDLGRRNSSNGKPSSSSTPPKKVNSCPSLLNSISSIDGYPKIMEAIHSADVGKLPDLLNLTSLVNGKGQNVLHLAIIHGKKEMIEGLLKKGFDIYNADSDGNNCLHLACYHGRKDIVTDLIISKQMDQGRIRNDGFTAFHCAASNKQLDIMKLLHEKFPACLSFVDAKGRTADHLAAENGDVDTLQWLLENKMLSTKKLKSFDLAHSCVVGGHIKVMDWLHSFDASRWSVTDAQGRYPIHYAAEKGQLDALKWFKSKKISLDSVDSAGRNIAHIAAMTGQIHVIQWLKQEIPNSLKVPDLSTYKAKCYAEIYKKTHLWDATNALHMIQLLMED